jgi:hypothetical protein
MNTADTNNKANEVRRLDKITDASMQATREWFAENQLACIRDVESGEVKVNDRERYFAWCIQQRQDALAGRWDHTATFLQRAYFIQTGDCPALLSHPR